jgi:diguanylate cyclase (GGDEF)-like protein
MGRSAALQHVLPAAQVPVTPEVAMALLLSALGLEFSRTRQPVALKRVGAMVALLMAILSGVVLAGSIFHLQAELTRLGANADGMPGLTAGAFLALALVMLLSPARKGWASHAADFCVSVFCLLVLVMVRGYLFEGLTSGTGADRTSLLTLLALALLAFVAFMHRAETGLFATLLGVGSGSRIARFAAPVVLLVPFLPRSALAHAVQSGWLSADYLTAMVEFLVAGVILALMLYMALKINRLEEKIRDLSLRDDLTGLHNRRGFHLVGWQILRQARRDGIPFALMYVELENLRTIHSTFGEQARSEALIEMAEVMVGAFRATDVLGRIDPALFALAGHFEEKSSTIMRLRLQEAVNYRNSHPGRTFMLAINVTCVFAKDPRAESLEDLMAQADSARDRDLPSPAAPPRYGTRNSG